MMPPRDGDGTSSDEENADSLLRRFGPDRP